MSSAGQPVGLTADEAARIRNAAMLAAALVADAEPGFLDSIRESMAAGRALRSLSPALRDIMGSGGVPSPPPASDKATVERVVLEELAQAHHVLQQRAPELAAEYRDFVVRSCRDVAAAAGGTSGREQGVITAIERALDPPPTR